MLSVQWSRALVDLFPDDLHSNTFRSNTCDADSCLVRLYAEAHLQHRQATLLSFATLQYAQQHHASIHTMDSKRAVEVGSPLA